MFVKIQPKNGKSVLFVCSDRNNSISQINCKDNGTATFTMSSTDIPIIIMKTEEEIEEWLSANFTVNKDLF